MPSTPSTRRLKPWCSLGLLAVVASVALAGCNALSGVEDLRFDPDAGTVVTPSPEGGSTPAIPLDGGAETAARFVCPRGLADCNKDQADGCEVDTQKDERNCGSCGNVCTVAGSVCNGGQCGPPPPSCKALLANAPGSMSGTYFIDPDGIGGNPSLSVTCDMDTAGGGWTLIFNPTSFANATTALDYTVRDNALLAGAAETLLVFRDATEKAVGTTAVFAFPSDWKQQPPFRSASSDLNIAVKLDGAAAVTKLLRYGTAYFHSVCTDEWDDTRSYGRICIAGTTAPFYVGFAAAGTDFCITSAQSWNQAYCAAERHFTIGIR